MFKMNSPRQPSSVPGTNLFRRTFEKLPVALCIINPDSSVEAVNPAFAKMFDQSVTPTGTVDQLFPSTMPESERRNLFTAIRQAQVTGDATMELEWEDAPGNLKSFGLEVQKLDDSNSVLVQIEPMSEPNKDEAAIATVSNLQAEKMESISRVTATIAHDFNNFLTSILGFGHMAVEEAAEGSSMRADLEEIVSSATKAHAFTQSLARLSQRDSLRPESLCVNELISGQKNCLEQHIQNNLALEYRLDDSISPIHADAGALLNILSMLLNNAAEAIPSDGKIILSSRQLYLDSAFCKLYPSLSAGAHIQVAIQDTGCGMNEEMLQHAFEPFFSSKEGKDVGFGLSLVFCLMRRHKGVVNLISSPSKGTTVNLYFPVMPVQRDESKPTDIMDSIAPPAESVDGPGTETILFVEDQTVIRKMGTLILQRLGYKVIEAENGEEGINIYNSRSREISLVISDVIMPKVSGPEMIDTLRETFPDLKCLFVSGYAHDILQGSQCQDVPLVMKPFTRDLLGSTIRKLLDEPEHAVV
jgi:two-component system cell cycle sensor histidine kinase/response regulator CckA